MRNHQRRLQKVEQQVLSIPIAREVVEQAFAVFQKTGELPEDVRLAYDVVKRTKHGPSQTWADVVLEVQRSIREFVERKPRPEDEVMDMLYDEAVFGTDMVRWGARAALVMLAKLGMDPTKPLFAGSEVKLPEFSSVGLHLMDIDGFMTKPPYEEQAQRLFARRAKVREQVPQNREWFAAFNEATERFQHTGERPSDDLMLDAILLLGEEHTLMDHACGKDVDELMAAFDAAAQGTGPAREEAIGRLRQMAQEGRFGPSDDSIGR